ncbi:hypothetical protein LQW54_001527 [Pestalotiopsis sp. IQ-011]
MAASGTSSGESIEMSRRPESSEPCGPLQHAGDNLPGSPLISMRDKAAVHAFLARDLTTRRLYDIYSILFLTSNRRNISPLHHQIVKGRRIVPTERCDLHLLWHYERIFVKPIPKYLLCPEVWDLHLSGNGGDEAPKTDSLYSEACGFLRTYAELIVHESDFDLAQELKLVPKTIDWESWCRFVQPYSQMRDSQVSLRYHYGEIRLTRLNIWTFLRYGESYFEVHYNYFTYFSRFGPPMLYILASITVLLEALQTLAQVPPDGQYRALAEVFSPFCMILAMCGLGVFPLLYMGFQIQELFLFVYRHKKPLR